jgi:hypothetical protein
MTNYQQRTVPEVKVKGKVEVQVEAKENFWEWNAIFDGLFQLDVTFAGKRY